MFFCRDLPDEFTQVDVSPHLIKKNVQLSLKKLFGEVGASINIDVLKCSSSKHRAFIRCPSDNFIKLHCALTLAGKFEGIQCAYRIHNISPTLITLASNSRTYKHS